jgi:hypothetical protein
MTKSETMKQLAAASNAARLDDLGQRIESLRSARIESAEQLASMLEPLAQAMAALTDETRLTLEAIEQRSREQGERFKSQVEAATTALSQASAGAEQAAENLDRVGQCVFFPAVRLVRVPFAVDDLESIRSADGPLLFRGSSRLRRIGAGVDLLLHFQALVARSRQSHDRVGAEGQAVLLAVGLCIAQPP